MHLFIHNSFHAGDVALTRLLIATLQETFPELELTLECRPCYRYLWEDFGLPIVPYEGSDHTTTDPTPNCPPDAFFINAWFGLYDDILTAFSLTYPNNVYSFNRQMKTYDPEGKYKLSVPDVTPLFSSRPKPNYRCPLPKTAFLSRTASPVPGKANSLSMITWNTSPNHFQSLSFIVHPNRHAMRQILSIVRHSI